jgi:DNA-binding transcriptional ArsR family regulator
MAMESDPINEVQAAIFKAIGHPIRLRIVKCLTEGERMVTDIVNIVGAEQSNVSRHLALLKQAGVLASRKSGLKVYYRLASTEFLSHLTTVLDHISSSAGNGGHAKGVPQAVGVSAAASVQGN